MSRTKLRKGMPDVQLTRAEFERRFRNRFFDPAFAKNEAAIKAIIDTAWDGYDVYRKNPIKRVAGEGYAKPKAHLLSGIWLLSMTDPTVTVNCSRHSRHW